MKSKQLKFNIDSGTFGGGAGGSENILQSYPWQRSSCGVNWFFFLLQWSRLLIYCHGCFPLGNRTSTTAFVFGCFQKQAGVSSTRNRMSSVPHWSLFVQQCITGVTWKHW